MKPTPDTGRVEAHTPQSVNLSKRTGQTHDKKKNKHTKKQV